MEQLIGLKINRLHQGEDGSTYVLLQKETRNEVTTSRNLRERWLTQTLHCTPCSRWHCSDSSSCHTPNLLTVRVMLEVLTLSLDLPLRNHACSSTVNWMLFDEGPYIVWMFGWVLRLKDDQQSTPQILPTKKQSLDAHNSKSRKVKWEFKVKKMVVYPLR